VALRTDLVLEGGGVRGFALVGAVHVLADAGYDVVRVAGTSAGAVVAAVVAALGRAGEPLTRLAEVVATLDPSRVRRRGALGRALGPLGVVADLVSLLDDGGVADGRYLRTWLGGVLADLGVEVFADLALTGEAAQGVPAGRRWSLLVTATDVSRRRAVRLPEDYPRYGLDPDAQRVVDAVAASAAIPFVLDPVRLRVPSGPDATLVDGGLLSNYPITAFDRRDGERPRWPTIGVRLATPDELVARTRRVRGPVSLAAATLATLLGAAEARLVEDPCVLDRTITVPTGAVALTDFDLTDAERARLLAAGRQAAHEFLARWDWSANLRRCRCAPG
jgi:NTE family protein